MSTEKVKYGTKQLEKDLGALSFASVLLSHRLGEELTQVEMADLLGISKQNLCDLEKGRKIPSPSRAHKIAIKLKMLPESFIQLALQDQLTKENLNYKISIVSKNKKVS
jgi:transcriptional regulator with XRE-family HTH domain